MAHDNISLQIYFHNVTSPIGTISLRADTMNREY